MRIRHVCIAAGASARRATVGAIVAAYAGRNGKSIVFTETKKEADELSAGVFPSASLYLSLSPLSSLLSSRTHSLPLCLSPSP